MNPVEAGPAPRVTVVMAVYNAAPFLREAVASVLDQTLPDFELIAVEDASSDDSLAILESINDPRLRIIRHGRNLGASLSRNHALREARGEFVAILDADDICAANRLERQIEFLDAHPNVGVVGCAIYENIDESGAVLSTTLLPEDNSALQRTLMKKWCFLHSSLIFRKSLQDSVGGYRAAFEPAEDHDFMLRMLERSEAHNLGEPLVRYRLSEHGLSVRGYSYVEELRELAVQLARERRAGEKEDLEARLGQSLNKRRTSTNRHGLAALAQAWSDSMHAAKRYYELGCHEMWACNFQRARRCFADSFRANRLFAKSWTGYIVSLMPPVAQHLRSAYRLSETAL